MNSIRVGADPTLPTALDPWPQAGVAVLAPVAEHDDLRQVTRDVLAKSGPIEEVRATVETAPGYSAATWHQLAAELGLVGLAVPEASGGLGMTLRELAVVLEETGATLAPEPVLASAALGAQALLQADDPADVADLLEDTVAGECVTTLAWADCDLVVTDTSAGPVVSGRASRVLQGGAAGALVAPASRGDRAVLVALRLPDGPQVRRDELTVLDPTRRQADLVLDGVPARVLAGAERCPAVSARLATLRRIAVAAEHAGIVARLLDLTVDYVREREQFGRAIGSFQAVKHRLADVLVDRERVRSAARYAAAVGATDLDAAELPSLVAAAVGTDAVVRAAHETVQLHGGIGFTWEHQAHLYVRRALGDEGLFGSASSHRRRIARLVGV